MKRLLLSTIVLMGFTATTYALPVTVTITNNSSGLGVGLAPVWVGFHNGSFDSHNTGEAASSELETLAEVGSPAPLSNTFAANGTLAANALAQTGTRVQGNTGLLPQGAVQTLTFDVATDGSNSFFSYASMILPSSDYFIANDNPFGIDLSSILSSGGEINFNIGLPGFVKDAGTEINDFAFSAGNPLVGIPGGDAANGADENGVVALVDNPFAGFLNAPGGFDFAPLNFNDSALYPNGIASIRISAASVPIPGTLGLASLGLLALFTQRRKKSDELVAT